MDKFSLKSCCDFSLGNASMAIGVIHTIIFGALFLIRYAMFLSQTIHYGFSLDDLYHLTLGFSINSDLISATVFGVLLVIGVRQGRAGFVLGWILNQSVFIFTTSFALLYFTVLPFLKIPLTTGLIQIAIDVVQIFFLIIVLYHFQDMNKGNLRNEV